jgi:hypothetical protein
MWFLVSLRRHDTSITQWLRLDDRFGE